MYMVMRRHPKQGNNWITVRDSEHETEEECRTFIEGLGGPFEYAVVPVPVPVEPQN